MEKNTTAIEWLLNEFSKYYPDIREIMEGDMEEMMRILSKCMEIQKSQIMEAYSEGTKDGFMSAYSIKSEKKSMSALDYYNNIYGK